MVSKSIEKSGKSVVYSGNLHRMRVKFLVSVVGVYLWNWKAIFWSLVQLIGVCSSPSWSALLVNMLKIAINTQRMSKFPTKSILSKNICTSNNSVYHFSSSNSYLLLRLQGTGLEWMSCSYFQILPKQQCLLNFCSGNRNDSVCMPLKKYFWHCETHLHLYGYNSVVSNQKIDISTEVM